MKRNNNRILIKNALRMNAEDTDMVELCTMETRLRHALKSGHTADSEDLNFAFEHVETAATKRAYSTAVY